MKYTRFLTLTLWLAALSLPVVNTFAQGYGRIAGRVLDEKTGQAIVGASVGLKEDPVFFNKTDLDGAYQFQEVPSGSYTIRVFKSGYEPYDVSGVTVTDGEVNRIDIPLPARGQAEAETSKTDEPAGELGSGEIFELSAFEVTAEKIQNSEVGLLELRQRSISIGDAIGSDFINRSGVSDAAQAMTKVVGANVVDGKYAVIRGLGDRYSNTLLNGAALPSNDPSKKTVQLDIIPADLLEEINTTKTFTPDKPGDFTGGSVNVSTKAFPDEFILKAGVSVGYNSQTTGEEIAVIPDAGMDFFGEIKTTLPSVVPPTPSEYATLNKDDKKVVVRAIHEQPLFPTTKKADPSWGLQFTVGDSKPVMKNGKIGYVFSFTRDESSSFIDDKIRARYIGTDADQAKSGYLVNDSTQEVSWGAIVNLAFQWNPLNEITYNYIKNQKGESSVSQGRSGFDTETPINIPGRSVSSRNLPTGQTEAVEFLEYTGQLYTLRELDAHQIKGRHVFDGLNNVELKWMGSFSETSENTPISRSYTNNTYLYPNGVRDSFWMTENPRYPERIYGTLKDSRDNYTIDLKIPVRWEAVTALTLKTGYSLSKAERVSLQRNFSYDWSLRIPGRDADQRIAFYETIQDPIWVDGDVPGFGSGAITIEEKTTTSGNARSYFGNEDINAYYLMGDLEVTDWLRFIAGARVEETDIFVEANEPFVNPALTKDDIDEGSIKETDVLPAGHFVIRLGTSGTMNVRGSYGRTLARPTFREFSPFRSTDTQTKETIAGNPDLERTLVDNFDLRWEWFITPGEVLAVSIYHKEFDKPIVSTVRANSSSEVYSWTNVDSGTISGIELEIRKTLFERFVVGGNFSLIESEIDPVNGSAGSATVFEGQPDYILNFNVGYNDEKRGLTANIFYNYVDDTLRYVGQNVPSVFEKGRTSLDFNISKLLAGIQFKFSVKNILDDEIEFYYDSPTANAYEKYKRGRSYSLSASYKF